jgi:predicted nucleotidyltransferase
MFGLPPKNIDLILEYFDAIPEIERVIIYGSKDRGDYNQSSDIDFAFFCNAKNNMTGKLLT